ncbi:DedA family protein [Intrasporangium calvum]|uniref:SNARE associated Golgi protein-like protein n=1 Tax=Intrasporangium calvum (strain ATCC 23552 / DSM 43043 / JCM 3097 / NBRC 12989 / NCIMB 10167 / NRRL B-3866 / 7 KIP) TaxID=710696 RepID=E6SDS2_INTC7|nr:VTT domain-containing protein [Intrasporangium calvum]ADU49753.1 SNARE associated Golgi protein-like protein [Intrasporangium calvum DSM 43043]
MHALATLAPTLGPDWMDPAYLLNQYGAAFFWISLAIIFVECGLLFPILPGDSLLFAVGLFIAIGEVHINIGVAIAALCVAAFAGNVTGYEIGRAIGHPLYERDGRFVNKANFDKTTAFFDKHGNKALVIGRFVPIVRTFITVVAGVSRMERRRFFTWSAVGAVLWAAGITLLGYFLGGAFPWLQDKLEVAILLIVGVSVLPMVFEYLKHRREANAIARELGEAAEEVVEEVAEEVADGDEGRRV